MKNILFIISGIHKLGGSERVAISLANELSKSYKVTILSRGNNSTKNAYPLIPAVNDIKIDGNNLAFIKHIKRYVKENSPDKIIIHTMSKLTPILLLSNLNIDSIWSLEHISFESHPKFYQLLRKLLYRKLEKVLVFTDSQKEIFLNYGNNVEIIRNPSPFPITTNTYNTDSKIIVSIGSLEHRKGFDMLIESWSIVSSKHPDWTLNIYGEGKDKDFLQSKINDLNIKNINLKGQVHDTCSVYDNASFYVMSSRFEGLPMVLIEAQSRGLPLVSFDCPTGPREIIENEKNGILVPPNDVQLLAISIIELIDDSQKRSNMSYVSKQNAENFTSNNVINSWIKLLES